MILEEGVESIGRCALSECEALKGVSIPSSITIINSNPLTDWPKLARIEVSEDNNEYSTMNGVLFDKEKTSLISYPQTMSEVYEVQMESKR